MIIKMIISQKSLEEFLIAFEESMYNICIFSISGSCSLAIMASFMECIQHTAEQYLQLLTSLEPTHCINTTLFGGLPSEGLSIFPRVGPEALINLSNSMEEMMFSYLSY